MDDDRLAAEILAVISDHGPASLEALLDSLSPARPGQVARAFQGARAEALIEAIPDRTRRGEPIYRLTSPGRARLQSLAGAGEPRAASAGSRLTIEGVLCVVEELDEASLGLVAWELSMSEEEVSPMWELALAEGLLVETRFDAVHKEQMAQLTPRGRGRLEVAAQEAG